MSSDEPCGGPVGTVAVVGCAADQAAELLIGAGLVTRTHATAAELEADGRAAELVVLAEGEGAGHQLPVVPSRDGQEDNSRSVVVVCRGASAGEVRSLLAAGVHGVVLADDMPRTLVPTVAAVSAGQVCVPRQLARGVGRPVLSTREKQVVGLAAIGLMNSEIAERLFLAESTVKSHLSSAFAKLGVRSRNEAIELILDPASGLGIGILSLDAETMESSSEPAAATAHR